MSQSETEEAPEVTPPKFRVNRKKFGFTYSCPRDAEANPIGSKEILLTFLNKFGPHQYIIALEPHQSGKAHYHVYAKFDAAIQTTNAKYFDCCGVHPNIIKPGSGWEGYCVKHEDFITNYYERGTFKRAAEADTWTKAADLLWKREPKFMLQHGESCERNWKRRKTSGARDLVFYGPSIPSPEGWDACKQALIITGPAGVGKTQWALDYARRNGGTYLKCGHYQKIKGYNNHGVVIFDDACASLNNQDASTWIALTDVEQERDMRVLHGCVSIPAGVPKIFLTNGDLKPNDNSAGAVKRRVFMWDYPVEEYMKPKDPYLACGAQSE